MNRLLARVMAVYSTPRVISMGAPSRAARMTARYSLPWALCTVTAKAGSSSPSISGVYSTNLPSKSTRTTSLSTVRITPMSPLNIPMPEAVPPSSRQRMS